MTYLGLCLTAGRGLGAGREGRGCQELLGAPSCLTSLPSMTLRCVAAPTACAILPQAGCHETSAFCHVESAMRIVSILEGMSACIL